MAQSQYREVQARASAGAPLKALNFDGMVWLRARFSDAWYRLYEIHGEEVRAVASAIMLPRGGFGASFSIAGDVVDVVHGLETMEQAQAAASSMAEAWAARWRWRPSKGDGDQW